MPIPLLTAIPFPPIVPLRMPRRPTMEDELREKIIDLLYGKLDRPQQAKGLADSILALLAPELDKLKRFQREAHLLAMFILQSPYYKDPDVREAVDNVLGLTMVDVIKGEVKDAG
jgi:hypothetical protein